MVSKIAQIKTTSLRFGLPIPDRAILSRPWRRVWPIRHAVRCIKLLCHLVFNLLLRFFVLRHLAVRVHKDFPNLRQALPRSCGLTDKQFLVLLRVFLSCLFLFDRAVGVKALGCRRIVQVV